MSTNEERNTHFQGSARQVAYKILDLAPGALAVYSRDDQYLMAELIAQYAYDLAVQSLIYATTADNGFRLLTLEQAQGIINQMPDLNEWPTTAD